MIFASGACSARIIAPIMPPMPVPTTTTSAAAVYAAVWTTPISSGLA